jgi:hypothetical protein
MGIFMSVDSVDPICMLNLYYTDIINVFRLIKSFICSSIYNTGFIQLLKDKIAEQHILLSTR